MVKMGPAAASPDAYVAALTGWQRERVTMLRAAVNAGAAFQESIKWTNLLFALSGPCIVIRAEESRVILAFFRGKRLTHFDPRIKASGKYELASFIMGEATDVDPDLITKLAHSAAELNLVYGDPTIRHKTPITK
jgi:hypothetical protein